MEKKKNIAVITGASKGIGLSTAKLFLKRGWIIITCSRNGGDKVFSDYADFVFNYNYDLANETHIADFVAIVDKILDGRPLDALINNAGVSPKAENRERLCCLNGDISAWKEVLETNFFAPLRLSKGLVSALSRGNGSIVNVTSIAGHKVHPFASSAYSSSKSALSALTREMANEFSGLNVRVNAVAPGEISTDMIQPEYEMLIPRIPLNRMGSARDVANTIFFLCSEEANYLTGTEIWVTGGQHMY